MRRERARSPRSHGLESPADSHFAPASRLRRLHDAPTGSAEPGPSPMPDWKLLYFEGLRACRGPALDRCGTAETRPEWQPEGEEISNGDDRSRRFRSVGDRPCMPRGEARPHRRDVGARARGGGGDQREAHQLDLSEGSGPPGEHPRLVGRGGGRERGGDRDPGPTFQAPALGVRTGGGRGSEDCRRGGRQQGNRRGNAAADVRGARGDDARPRARKTLVPLRSELREGGRQGPADRCGGGVRGDDRGAQRAADASLTDCFASTPAPTPTGYRWEAR